MEKLSSGQIFNKTFIFVLLKILLSAASFLASIIVLSIIAAITDNALIEAAVWLVLTVGITFAINYFVGYYVKAGHVAAVTDAASVGLVPDDVLKVSINTVKERFPTCNDYFLYRKSLNGSINQLQKTLNVFAARYRHIIVVGSLISLLQTFVGTALNFMIDCCMGYTFWKDGKGLYTSASDAAVIYNLSWKRLFDKALMLAVQIIVAMVLVFLVIFCIFVPLFTSVYNSDIMAGALGAVSLGFFTVSAIKNGIIDSDLMIKTMSAYFDEAKYIELAADDYAQACKASPKYQALYNKAQSENNTAANAAATNSGNSVPPTPPIR